MSGRSPIFKTLDELQAWSKEQQRLEAIDKFLAKHPVPAPVLRRPTGRPPWTPEPFGQLYRDAVDHCAPGAKDEEIAQAMKMSVDWFRRLRRRFAGKS